MQILNASAFIHEYHTDGETASIPLTKKEPIGEHTFRFDALEGAGIHVYIPGQRTVNKVLRAAGKTGDRNVLSETDTCLITAVLELDATLITDDYAVQNVAERPDIGVRVIAQDGIAEQRTWKFQCQDCGREFDEDRECCPICEMKLSQKNPA